MVKDNVNILWVSPNPSPNQEHIANLKQVGFHVECCTTQAPTFSNGSTPDILIISQQPEFHQAIEVFDLVKKQVASNPLLTILSAEKLTLQQKEQFFKEGGNEVIIGEFGSEELQSKFDAFTNLEHQIDDLGKQATEASQMALLAMETSSDLGNIINFVKTAINCETYEELASHILEVIHLYSENVLIELKALHHFAFFPDRSDDKFEPMRLFMSKHKNSNRVQHIGNKIQINHENLTLLVDDLPDDDSPRMGRITDSLVMLCDISNRFVETLRVEEIIQKSEQSKNRFLTTLSHELRTPLNSIRGFAQVLLGKKSDKPLGKSGLDALSRIADSSDSVNTIVNTLLEIAASQSQLKDLIDIDAQHLSILLENEFKASAEEKGLTFICNRPESIVFKSHESKVHTMLKQLLDNAIKFTANGSIMLSIRRVQNDAFGDQICFEVSDTGIGIDPVNHKRIFEEIGQLNTDHDRSYFGMGLGLYYVYHIAQQLDGEVEVDSKLGNGATFRLYFPIHTPEVDHSDDDGDTTLF